MGPCLPGHESKVRMQQAHNGEPETLDLAPGWRGHTAYPLLAGGSDCPRQQHGHQGNTPGQSNQLELQKCCTSSPWSHKTRKKENITKLKNKIVTFSPSYDSHMI